MTYIMLATVAALYLGAVYLDRMDNHKVCAVRQALRNEARMKRAQVYLPGDIMPTDVFIPERKVRYTVSVKGYFHVTPAQLLENHCGIDARQVMYDVSITAPLNARGFVVDVLQVHEFFKRTYEREYAPLKSCEETGHDAIEALRVLCPGCTAVRIGIRASSLGTAYAEWAHE